ncbi:heterochromatin protein 1-binding protein 3-like [Anastrepha ludens]|uniref:heterochromatin protein 1-binding protein 3-like n=1 Tax=Anastrepha ludens TaxID=28586 RepID=UPI0023AFD512|nr:heterochromatin protein 1-binding protein 3-like [Anastrepha ludens]
MKKSLKTINRTKEMLKNDLRYFKQRQDQKSAAEFVGYNSSDLTSWSSNASMQYRKFHPEALLLRVLKGLNEPNGSSVVAIKKYIINHYPYVDGKFTLSVIRKIIRRAIFKGKVVQSQGCTMDGLFKISGGEIRVKQRQEQFKHYKECVKLREQQKLELERRINESRAKGEKRRRPFPTKHIKQGKEIVNTRKKVRAPPTTQQAKAKKKFIPKTLLKKDPAAKVTPAKIPPANVSPANALLPSAVFRLGAGSSKSFLPKPQIVDYADAAIETAKVISSELLKAALIKNAEYTPYLAIFDNSDPKGATCSSMPLKCEKTIRRPTVLVSPSTVQPRVLKSNTKTTQASDNVKLKEINKKVNLVTHLGVSFPSPPAVPFVKKNITSTKFTVAGNNVRRV